MLVLDGCGTVVDGALGAIPGDEDRVVRQADDVPGGKNLGDRVFHQLPGLFAHDVKDGRERLTYRILVGPPGKRLRDRIEESDPSVGIGGDDAISNTVQGHSQLLPLSLDHLGVMLRRLTCCLFLEQAAGIFFCSLPLRHVPGDLGEASQVALNVAHRRENHAGPEAGAVLAQPPALLLVSPLGRSLLEFHLGLAGLNVFSRVEARKVLADDFFVAVLLDAFRPGVP